MEHTETVATDTTEPEEPTRPDVMTLTTEEMLAIFEDEKVQGFKAGSLAVQALQDVMKHTRVEGEKLRQLPVMKAAGFKPTEFETF